MSKEQVISGCWKDGQYLSIDVNDDGNFVLTSFCKGIGAIKDQWYHIYFDKSAAQQLVEFLEQHI